MPERESKIVLPAIRLIGLQRPDDSIVLHVEGTQRRRSADGTGGDQRVEKAQAVGKVKGLKIGERPGAVGCRRPDDREGLSQLQGFPHLILVLGVLDQLHDNKAWNRRQLIQLGEPVHRGLKPALNVDQDVRVDEEHGRRLGQLRRSA